MASSALAPANDDVASLQWKLVTHHQPDTDAYLCLWGARKFVVKDESCSLVFVPAGEGLPAGEAEGFCVLTMDTGRGELDQHEKGLERSSSFVLLCEKYGLTQDPALQPLIELSRASDNIEVTDFTSVHHVLKGLWHYYRDPDTKEVNWQEAVNHAFVLFDILYDQAAYRRRSKETFAQSKVDIEEVPNGLKFCSLFNKPFLRNAAYEAGVDVVFWTSFKKGNKFQVGIQVNRNSAATLATVMEGIRIAEGNKRGISLAGHKLGAIGNNSAFGGWFLHDSGKLILCGSNSHELEPEEYTKLSVNEIKSVLRKCLMFALPSPNKK